MGYEVRLIAGRTSSITMFSDKTSPVWLQVSMEIELNKIPYLRKELENLVSEDVYIYASDGDTQIEEDKYGEKLKAYPVDLIVKALRIVQEDAGYEYLYHAINCLDSLRSLNKYNQIKVIPFGR